MKTFVILSTILLLFSGCGTQKRVVVAKPKELPSWYKTPMHSSSSTLYGVGEGESRDEAIANALNAMASTLSVSISSEFKTKSVVKEGEDESYRSTSINEVKSSVKKIRISSYEVVESEQLGFKKYIALVKSDKRKLFESLREELNQKFKIIDDKRAEIQNYNAIKQLSIYKEAKNSVVDVPNTLIVMNVLQKDFDDSVYLRKLKEVDKRYEQLLSSITFSVQSNSQAENLIAAIRKGLSAKKLILKKGSGKMHFNIYISSTAQNASSYGFSLVRSAIAITVKDSTGAVIGSNKLNITGQSTQGYAIAKENVAAKLNAMVKKEGIAKVLGLEL